MLNSRSDPLQIREILRRRLDVISEITALYSEGHKDEKKIRAIREIRGTYPHAPNGQILRMAAIVEL